MIKSNKTIITFPKGVSKKGGRNLPPYRELKEAKEEKEGPVRIN